MSLWLLLTACSAPEPSSWQACATLDGVARQDCQGRMFPRAFCDDAARAEALVLEHVEDATVRDFIWYQVTLDVDPTSSRWCQKIVDDAIRARCDSVVKRPHLQRGVTPMCGTPQAKSGGVPAPGALPGAPAR